MPGNEAPSNQGGDGGPTQHQLSIEKACDEYNKSVKMTLHHVNRDLDDLLLKNCNALDELSMKIAARMNFLERNPTFLTCLVYEQSCVKCEPLSEFDDIRITLKEHSRRIYEKVDEIQKNHKRVLDLVVANGRDNETIGEGPRANLNQKEAEEDFQDCLDRPKEESMEATEEDATEKIKKAPSFDKVTIQKDAYSDNSLDAEPVSSPIKFQIFPDIVPDVYRGRPNEDLHARLCQLVNNDSLENFLSAMEQKAHTSKQKKIVNLEQKYTGSLWFFPKDHKKSRKSPNKVSSSSVSTCVTLSVTSSQPCPPTNQEKSERVKQGLSRNRLQYYDLLDDVDQNDIRPIRSEYPRRDNAKPLKQTKSYLHRMMHENEKVWKKLLQPTEKKKKPKGSQVIASKSQQIKNLMEYLTSPEQKILNNVPRSLIVMPVKVSYDNFPTKLKKVEARPFQSGEERRKEMLDQLKGLKSRNDNIQRHIQRAIEVIEGKMIDLLSSPTDGTTTEAFNTMEKEISSVLQMMAEEKVKSEKEKMEDTPKTEKNESGEDKAERDASEKVAPLDGPKLKKITEKWEAAGEGNEKKEREESKEKRSAQKKEDPKREQKREETKPTRDKPKPMKSPRSNNENWKKTANIEEGERLLGQVDSVIRKIDSIYNRFYDENRSKVAKPEPTFTNIADFFDVIREKKHGHVTLIEYSRHENTASVSHLAKIFHQMSLYYVPPIQLVTPPIAAREQPIELGSVSAPPIDHNGHVAPPPTVLAPQPIELDGALAPPIDDSRRVAPPTSVLAAQRGQPIELSGALAPPIDDSGHVAPPPTVSAPQRGQPIQLDGALAPPIDEQGHVAPPPIVEVPPLFEKRPSRVLAPPIDEQRRVAPPPIVEVVPLFGKRYPRSLAPPTDKRHASTLKAFYAIFFWSVFVALNFDYAA